MTVAESMTPYAQAPVRFTADEFMQLVQHPPLAERLGKIELVDGAIVHMAPANIPHWNAQRIVQLRLQSVFAELGARWIVGCEPTVRLAGDRVREPDVAVLRDPDFSATIFDRVALFLAVEIADTSLMIDRGAKLRDYAEAFVPHYWIVDLNGRQVFVNEQPRGGRYDASRIVRFGEPLAVPGVDATIVID